MRKINLGIRKTDVINRGKDKDYNYITNNHYIIRYGASVSVDEAFTAGTVRKLKDIKVKESVTWGKLFDDAKENEVTELKLQRSFRDTGFYKNIHGLLAKVYSTPAGMQYLNKRYTDFMKDKENYSVSYQNNVLRPVVFEHAKEDLTILIAPIRPRGGFERFEVVDRYNE